MQDLAVMGCQDVNPLAVDDGQVLFGDSQFRGRVPHGPHRRCPESAARFRVDRLNRDVVIGERAVSAGAVVCKRLLAFQRIKPYVLQ